MYCCSSSTLPTTAHTVCAQTHSKHKAPNEVGLGSNPSVVKSLQVAAAQPLCSGSKLHTKADANEW
jgi:hypothetical protein